MAQSSLVNLGRSFATEPLLGFAIVKKKAKIRNPMIALRISVLGRSIGYGSLMYENYINF